MRWYTALFFFLLLSSLGQGASPSTVSAQPRKGALWVFAVGVSQYHNPSLSLQYADNDAESLAKAFQTYSKKIFLQVKKIFS